MKKDRIKEIGINKAEQLYILPENARFPMIYRTATEVHWNEEMKFLYSPKPREWSYFQWYNHILTVVRNECFYNLIITEETRWENVPRNLKNQILTA